MTSHPLLAESHRFSMFFLLSSGCCSSLRWKEGDRQEEGREVEWSRSSQRETTTWMATELG